MLFRRPSPTETGAQQALMSERVYKLSIVQLFTGAVWPEVGNSFTWNHTARRFFSLTKHETCIQIFFVQLTP